MCDPVTALVAAGTAASVGGGVWQSSRAASDINRANQARSEAAQAELARQKGYRQESQALLDQTRQNVSRETYSQTVADAIAKRMAGAQNVASSPADTAVALRANAPQIVTQAHSTGQQGARDDSAARTAALAALFGNSDALAGQNLAQGRSGADIRLLSTLAGRSAGLNNYEQQIAAQNAQKGPSVGADILGGLGQMAMMIGLSGNNPFASSNAPTAGVPTPRVKPPRGM